MNDFKHDKTVKLSPESLKRLEMKELLTPDVIKYLDNLDKAHYEEMIDALTHLLETRNLRRSKGICGYLVVCTSIPSRNTDLILINRDTRLCRISPTHIVSLYMKMTGLGSWFLSVHDPYEMSAYRIKLTQDLILFIQTYLEIKNNDSK